MNTDFSKFTSIGSTRLVCMVLDAIQLHCLVWFLILALEPRCLANSQATTAIVDKLNALWMGWDEVVKSLDIKGYKFVGSLCVPENRLSHGELEKLVHQQFFPLIDEARGNSPEALVLEKVLQPMFRETFDPQFPNRPIGTWRPYSLVNDSNSIRVDDVLLGNTITTVRAGGVEQQYQASILQADFRPSFSNYHVENSKFFIYHPSTIETGSDWEFQLLGDGLHRANSKHSCVLFDIDTGFVAYHCRRDSNGRLYSERFQGLPLSTSLGVPIPRVIVDAKYFPATDNVKLLTIYVLNYVRVNQEVDQDRFALSVPAGTTIVDNSSIDVGRTEREGRTYFLMERSDKPVHDVRNFVKSYRFGLPKTVTQSNPRDTERSSLGSARISIILNIIAIAVIGGFLILRRVRR